MSRTACTSNVLISGFHKDFGWHGHVKANEASHSTFYETISKPTNQLGTYGTYGNTSKTSFENNLNMNWKILRERRELLHMNRYFYFCYYQRNRVSPKHEVVLWTRFIIWLSWQHHCPFCSLCSDKTWKMQY